MREVLRTLPATICLDPASLPQTPCKFEATPHKNAAGAKALEEGDLEKPEENNDDEVEDDEDFDEGDCAEVQGGTEKLDRWRARCVPGSSVVVRTPAQAAAAAQVCFGETSFPGRAAGASHRPPIAFRAAGAPLPAGQAGAAGGVDSNCSTGTSAPARGVPSADADGSLGRAVSEGPAAAMQIRPPVSKKRARSPTESSGEESAHDHQADAAVKKRKLS